jgi:hypothetical protein
MTKTVGNHNFEAQNMIGEPIRLVPATLPELTPDPRDVLIDVVRRYLAADERVFSEHYSVESIQGLADAMGALRAAMLAHDA